jgi:lysyl-tRNA synthetase class 2
MLERNALMEQRLAKVAALGAAGQPAFPNDFSPSHTAAEAYGWFAADARRLDSFVAIAEGQPIPQDLAPPSGAPVVGAPWVRMAGRVLSISVKGKVAFIKIQDRSAADIPASKRLDDDLRETAGLARRNAEGATFQFYFSRDADPDTFDRLCKATADAAWDGPLLDVGDFVGGQGLWFRTRTGEPSLWLRRQEDVADSQALRILTKAVRPLPDKWHGLADKESRHRMRYVDLIVNDDVREVFRKRSQIMRCVRNYLDAQGYVEVETPMMHSVLGGAAARPFKTHHNALDMPLYLRIAPELYLKRLVVGGMERVYEVNRNFRNEGLSVRHNPEFTMLEFYRAYATFLDLMTEVETLIRTTAEQVCGTTQLVWGKNADGSDRVIDVGQPFARVSIRQGLQKWAGIATADLDNEQLLRQKAESLGVHIDAHATLGKVQVELFEAVAEPLLVQPTFVYEYPAETSPLARRSDADPRFVDRFELFVGGIELSNAFSELNDPVDQYERFLAQLAQKAKGDEEAMEMDLDYVRALEFGLPPTAGCGIGMDRLVMLLTGTEAIREVILFPHMRPEVRGGGATGESDASQDGDGPVVSAKVASEPRE